MNTSPSEWLDTFDRVITKPGRYGVFGLGISAVVYIAISFELIDPKLLGGHIRSYVGIAIAITACLTLYGLVFLAWRIMLWMTNLISEWNQRNAESKRLLENLQISPDHSLTMLLLYLQQPSGRFQAPGRMTAFDHLITYDLVEEDYRGYRVIYTEYDLRTPFRVNPLLYRRKKKVIPELTSRLSKATGLDLSDNRVLLAQYRIIIGL